MLVLRSLIFNLAFYLNTCFWLIVALPTFFMPYTGVLWVAKTWGRVNLWLLRVIAGIRYDIRGRERIPQGGLIVACKHQSAWETFALLHLFTSPTFIMKRELQWIPIFGWLTIKGRMVSVNRGAGAQALKDMAERARVELSRGRQLIIFPEGTRRAVDAEPRYKFGVAYLYAEEGVPVLPVALNSGLFWPRRTFLRHPGTVVVDILDPIPPGKEKHQFARELQETIERATQRLVDEARAAGGP
jgi:1-acyl-sn-glycerol-3-phosphate acyltransferase